jgi:hypothetical protein
MLRFLPDGWLDGLLRPCLLADPVNGLYVEIDAPDWRFAAVAVLLLLAWLGRPRAALLQTNQTLALLGLTVCFYVWTVFSGNGRYFIWALLIVGPMVVMAARRLRASLAMRNTVILLVLGVQSVSIAYSFMPNMWGLRPWRTGPGLALVASPLKASPAVFLTLGSVSYSALVPQMHPQSRWSNIAGQQFILPGVREYPELQKLLDSPLPHYAVVRATGMLMGPDGQPTVLAMKSLVGTLGRQQLQLSAERCNYVRTADAELAMKQGKGSAADEGFWFCAVRRSGAPAMSVVDVAVSPELDDVFAKVEQRCPRLFPAGNARSVGIDDAVQRHYSYSDTGLFVHNSGVVYFKYNRALNPTILGKTEDVRRGAFTIDCMRMPGRYLPPWERR